jgi:hypothetical protein
MLGLSPGKPAAYIPGDDLIEPRLIPPRGAGVAITCTYKDKQGKPHAVSASDWVSTGKGKKAKPPEYWVFIGSQVLPDGTYLADVEGEIISVSNFASAVIDVPFKSSKSDEARLFAVDKGAVPPVGTKVTVRIKPRPGARKAKHARALLEIDRLGQLRLNGQPMTYRELPKWAMRFSDDHKYAQVTIRQDARTLSWYVMYARDQMRFGGIYDFQEVRLGADMPILPRTAAQAKADLVEWDDKFANPQDYLQEPSQSSADELDHIDRELAELERLRGLWKEYRAQLEARRRKYVVSTQPASDDGTQQADE